MDPTPKRSCAFCGGAADSREHVFAKRLCKRAGVVRFLVIPGVFIERKGTQTRQEHYLEGVQVRRVCASCINGWMDDLESWFEGQFGFLVEPEWPKLAVTMIEKVRDQKDRLTQWMMKTAVTFSLAMVQGDLRVDFPAEMAGQVKDGKVPDDCFVDLAYSRLKTVGGTMGRGFRVINGGRYNPNQIFSQGLGFRFTVQFNHLLLRIARCPGANVTYQSWQGEFPIRLYPEPMRQIPVDFAYDDVMRFENAVVLETWAACPGNLIQRGIR